MTPTCGAPAATDVLVDATQRHDAVRPADPERLARPASAARRDLRSRRRPVPPGRRPADGARHRGDPAGEPRPVHLRRRRSGLGRASRQGSRPTTVGAVVSCYSWPGVHPKPMHGALREAARTTTRDARRAGRDRRGSSRRLVPRASVLPREPPRLAPSRARGGARRHIVSSEMRAPARSDRRRRTPAVLVRGRPASWRMAVSGMRHLGHRGTRTFGPEREDGSG